VRPTNAVFFGAARVLLNEVNVDDKLNSWFFGGEWSGLFFRCLWHFENPFGFMRRNFAVTLLLPGGSQCLKHIPAVAGNKPDATMPIDSLKHDALLCANPALGGFDFNPE